MLGEEIKKLTVNEFAKNSESFKKIILNTKKRNLSFIQYKYIQHIMERYH